jgi:sulfonate transport system ATP-binding protein
VAHIVQRDLNPSPDEGPATGYALRGVGRTFAGRVVLDDVNLEVAPGEFVALLGASGSGKTTILRAVAELDRHVTGILVLPRDLAVVFQEPRLLPWLRVAGNVGLGLARAGRNRVVAQALDEVGLSGRVGAWPGTLSGGEAQRVALARALVRQPDLLLLDEPFASLDALTRIKMQQLVGRLWSEHGFAVLLVTHDVDEALLLADRALVLESGRIAHDIVIDLPRPRRDDLPRFIELRHRLLDHLGAHLAA